MSSDCKLHCSNSDASRVVREPSLKTSALLHSHFHLAVPLTLEYPFYFSNVVIIYGNGWKLSSGADRPMGVLYFWFVWPPDSTLFWHCHSRVNPALYYSRCIVVLNPPPVPSGRLLNLSSGAGSGTMICCSCTPNRDA